MENRPTGSSTDKRHGAIVTGLQAYSPNRISIDPDQQPLEDTLDTAEKVVTPGWRQAARVTFGDRGSVPVRLRVRDPSGAVLPVGLSVFLTGTGTGAETVTGHGGDVFLASYPPPDTMLRITGAAQGACLVPLPDHAPADTLARPLIVTCRPEIRSPSP